MLAGEAATVLSPAARPRIADIAARAAFQLRAELDRLDAEARARLAALPLDAMAAAFARYPRWTDVERIGRPAEDVCRRVFAAGGAQWSAQVARLLLYRLLSAVGGAQPAIRVPLEGWARIEDGLETLLDAIPGTHYTDWAVEDFRKDLAVAQLRLLPNRGMAGLVIRAHPWYLMRGARYGERLRVVRYLGGGAFHSGLYFISHGWRAYRELRQEPFAVRNLMVASYLAENPRLAGEIKSGWVNDPALATISPHLWERTRASLSRGGQLFRMTTSPADVANALLTSSTRREVHAAGKYSPRSYGIITRRRDTLRWAAHERARAASESAAPRDPERPPYDAPG